MQAGAFNQVPYITGYTSAESLVMIRELLLDPSVLDTVNADPELKVPFWWNITRGSAPSVAIANEISNFYWNGAQLTNDIRELWTFVSFSLRENTFIVGTYRCLPLIISHTHSI